jgi:hypothetical protein
VTWDYAPDEGLTHMNIYGGCVGLVIYSNHLHQGCEYSVCTTVFVTAISDF